MLFRSKLFGARPMARLIQAKVKQPLAEELLFGQLRHGGEVHVSVKDGALSFALTPAPPKLNKRAKKAAVDAAAAKTKPKRKPKATSEPSGEAD